jgi:RNA polymerase sigma-70 factor (ECF subfamily)
MKLFRKNYRKSSDEELFDVLKGDKNAAFDELYRRYSKKMLFFFYQMLGGDEEKSQDFLHDLFLKILERPDRFDPQKRFSTWIYTCASNMCKNEYRNQKVRNVVHNGLDMNRFEEHTADAAEQTDNNLFKDLLHAELDQLSEDHRTTFILRFQEGLSVKEIAAIMECSDGTVKSRIFYTLKKLGKKLEMFDPKRKEELNYAKHH